MSLHTSTLTKVTFPDRELCLDWTSYPYRRNEFDEAYLHRRWEGYSGLYGDGTCSINGIVHNAWVATFLGVTRIQDIDRGSGWNRVTKHDRTVPVPDYGTPSSWISTSFQDIITHPDGTGSALYFVPPVNFPFPGPRGGTGDGSTLDEQMQTVAHLKHQLAHQIDFGVGGYASGAAYRETVYDRWDLRDIGNAQGSFLHGSVPHPTRTRSRDLLTGACQESENLAWDEQGRGWTWTRQQTQQVPPLQLNSDYLSLAMRGTSTPEPASGNTVYQKDIRRTFSAAPEAWIFGRVDFEQTTLTDAIASHDASLPSTVVQPAVTYVWDPAVPQRPSVSTMGPISTTYSYLGTQGKEAAQLGSVSVSGEGMGFAGPSSVGASYGYDPTTGHMTRISPAGATWSVFQEPDLLGRPKTQTDAGGRMTSITWKGAGRLDMIAPPGEEATTSFVYDADYRGVTELRQLAGNSDTQATHFRYNGYGELIQVIRRNADGSYSHRTAGYDDGGRKTWQTIWLAGVGDENAWTQPGPEEGVGWLYTYDAVGRPLTETDPNGVVTTTTYDNGGAFLSNPFIYSVKVGIAGTTTFTKDVLGRLVSVVDGKSNPTTYSYDSAGRMTKCVQNDLANSTSQTRAWTFNELGWLTGLVQPESGPTLYSGFTLTGKPTITTYKGIIVKPTDAVREVHTEFDALMRPVHIVATDGTVNQAFGYDDASVNGQGKLAWDQDGSLRRGYGYDAGTGHLVQLSTSHPNLPAPLVQSFEYDGFGQRTAAVVDGRRTATTFSNAMGLPGTVSYQGSLVVTAGYNQTTSWSLASLAFPGTIATQYTYDTDQVRLKSLKHFAAQNTAWAYTYDSAGRLKGDGEDSYSYDVLNRLATATIKRPDGTTLGQTYSYDGYGNLSSIVNTGNTAGIQGVFQFKPSDFSTNRLPAKLLSGAVSGAGYDAQGNLTDVYMTPGQSTTSRSLTYDALGRVLTVYNATTATTERFQYTPEGLRTVVETWSSAATPVVTSRKFNLYNDSRQLVSQYQDSLNPTPGGGTQASRTMALALPAAGATILSPEDGLIVNVNDVVSFSGASDRSQDVAWGFGDGSRGFSGFDATHVFTKSGTFTVTFAAFGDGSCTTSTATITVTVRSIGPQITLGASATTIPVGGTSRLTWSVTDGDTFLITDSVTNVSMAIPASGFLDVAPKVNTTYTVSSTGKGIAGIPKSVKILVVQMPVISSFSAVSGQLLQGQAATLSWVIGGIPTVALDGTTVAPKVTLDGGAVNGSSYTTPAGLGATTTFSLIATTTCNGVSVSSAPTQVRVKVTPVNGMPTINSFTSGASRIPTGTEVTLAWAVDGNLSGVVLSGVGPVGASGSIQVHPSSTTTYTLLATNTTGTVEKSLTVEVTQAPIVSFQANPTAIASGGSCVLNAVVTGATSVSVNQGVGALGAGGGNPVVKPTATTTYTLTATNALGATTTAQATVTIAPSPVITSFKASSPMIVQGAGTTLQWTFTGTASKVTVGAATGTGTPTTVTVSNVSGSTLVVNPSATTTYTLTVVNGAGTTTQSLKVTVLSSGTVQWKRDVIYMGAMELGEYDTTLHITQVDHLGSPRNLVNATAGTQAVGYIEARQKYTPFGELLVDGTTAGKFAKGFTNHEQTDASGLIYMQARFYLPTYGRFASPDPERDQHFEKTQSWNIYSYVQNNPITNFDPTGAMLVCTSPNSSDQAAFKRSLAYLSRDPLQRANIEKLQKSDKIYVVQINHNGNDNYQMAGQQTIGWDPHSSLAVVGNDNKLTGETLSPALSLGHELDHAAADDAGVMKDGNNPRYGINGNEEQRVIEGSEAHAAKTLKEGSRTNHKGVSYESKSETDRQPTARGLKKLKAIFKMQNQKPVPLITK